MANYKAYPEYKDSGVEWLGLVPESWTICRLKNLAAIKNGQDYKSVQTDDGYPVMGSGGQFTFASKFMYDKPSVLLGRKGTIDKPLYINEPFWTVDTMYYTELNEGFDARYLYYLALTIQFSRYSTNTALPSMTQEHLSNYKFSVPKAESERKKITKFLDHETAKIDNLIEKQQQLIELLKEKRHAVISHAVTKGLNPDVPMKDSGVEWLGEVPEHWTISTLKHHAKFIDGDRGSEYPNDNDLVDDGVVFLSSKNISNWEINIDDANYISREKFNRLNRGKAINGDVIVKVRGSTGRIGELAIFETERLNKSTAFINAQMMIIRLKNSFNNRFLCNVAQGHYWMEQLNVGAYGTAQQQLNNAIFSGMIMVVPPIDEQLTINKFLELEIKRFDGLIKNTSNMIQLIQERRTALISAAVTGKIDVRDWVAPDTQEAEEPQEVSA
ncbi:restriction endonuclease subunit S [Edwardsiella ictaluri]|uniref:Restriction modification system DNA specificity domain protein n=1 Tax=Edwardsiella ictaluri (strain 93-146) TaxID=634503 RepID=C5BH70_EDWI9|nr:restriction endonuclease subunit S [Edwardsiella ictaluri]ACR67753.1 restriction modification system DNA specificity domain protein [Edwardsiella ictaluri 93-146]AVZ81788.1 restriction endonuclease subunit S [Edwardsiella ictaluri]EKS7762124.1 restriction endonuclease subunit S [Edwardsiella ictaluri]EKS7768951.1 restriction endonuclease subunit S [Edwardsiella ictaluri]EKS7772100.1 restriction endonuclease subunit S [Edwardsiella ictaluri]